MVSVACGPSVCPVSSTCRTHLQRETMGTSAHLPTSTATPGPGHRYLLPGPLQSPLLSLSPFPPRPGQCIFHTHPEGFFQNLGQTMLRTLPGSHLPQRKARVLPMICQALHDLPPRLSLHCLTGGPSLLLPSTLASSSTAHVPGTKQPQGLCIAVSPAGDALTPATPHLFKSALQYLLGEASRLPQ